MTTSAQRIGAVAAALDPVDALRAMALRGLARMYDPADGRFVFRVRRTPSGIVSEGRSLRYTAITLIGLAGEEGSDARAVLAGVPAASLCASLAAAVSKSTNLGDVALTLWACRALRHHDWEKALRRLMELRPLDGPRATVELAWALSALSADSELPAASLRAALATRLVAAAAPSALFPHEVGGTGRGARSHVCCFADLVYPIHALSRYARLTGDRRALTVASRCAERMVERQGLQGQWWWHYDVRTGQVIEPYPVYAVHQDAMAPLALFALEDSSGRRFDEPVARGLEWLESAPELGGGSLIDRGADLVWRKVARHEPGKLARSLQAAASRLHPRLRVPAVDSVLPPGAVDYEDRPYHLGWLLHAWPQARRARARAGRTA